jgi:hypothetical protein
MDCLIKAAVTSKVALSTHIDGYACWEVTRQLRSSAFKCSACDEFGLGKLIGWLCFPDAA